MTLKYKLTRKQEKLQLALHEGITSNRYVMAYPLKILLYPKLDFFINRVSWDYTGPLKQKPWIISERLTGRSVGPSSPTIKEAVAKFIGTNKFSEDIMLQIIAEKANLNAPRPAGNLAPHSESQ